jgi:HTH-type transcriptional regulator / antitoxin HigA
VSIQIRKTFPPGRLLAEELEQRGWSQADFAIIIGRPARVVNEIIKAKRAVTPETALAIGGALGTGAQLWMNMETSYQLSKVDIKLEPIATRARMYNRFPIREMQKRGWIATTNSLEKLQASLLAFLGINDIDADLNATVAATKRSSYAQEISPVQAAWLARARQLAQHVRAPKFRPAELPTLYSRLRDFLTSPDDAKHVAPVLSEIGIRLLVVEAIPGSKIDGACLWISDVEPVIVLSLRYDRHDMFWHALMHELDHVEHGEGKNAPLVDKDLFLSSAVDKPAIEIRANNNAANHLIPQADLDQFTKSANKSYSEAKILEFAERQRVHPGIVVGQLQHHDCIPWSSYNFLKAKIRPFIVQHALTDGFGAVVK